MRYVFLGMCVLTQFVFAEVSQPVGAPPVGNSPQQGPSQSSGAFNRLNPGNIQVFDADFFKPAPQAAENTQTPKGRAYAADPDYNTETRQRAISKCDGLKNQNYAKFQECFKKDMTNSRKGIQDNYDDVENKQNIPLKNAPNPLIEEQMRNPSGFQEEN